MRLSASQIALMSRLLDEALPLDDAGRRRWLETLPEEFADLLDSLRQALLPEFHQSSDGRSFATFLESADPASGRVEPTGLQPGARVGPYELIRLLGAGGMAEVWLAKRADGAFNREVALKLPSMTRVRHDLEQRFFRERNISRAWNIRISRACTVRWMRVTCRVDIKFGFHFVAPCNRAGTATHRTRNWKLPRRIAGSPLRAYGKSVVKARHLRQNGLSQMRGLHHRRHSAFPRNICPHDIHHPARNALGLWSSGSW